MAQAVGMSVGLGRIYIKGRFYCFIQVDDQLPLLWLFNCSKDRSFCTLSAFCKTKRRKKINKIRPPTWKETGYNVVLIGPTIHNAESVFFTIHACR